MKTWPDAGESLLRSYIARLDLADSVLSRRPYESVLRRFQRFVSAKGKGRLDQTTVELWLREQVRRFPLHMAVRRAQIITRFLDSLVIDRHIPLNPIAELRAQCRRDSTAAVVRALVSCNPSVALHKLRGLPRFGSHLGVEIREHVERMRNLGFRCDENRFRRFDEFLQTRPDSHLRPFSALVTEYAEAAPTPAGYMERLKVGRALAKSLQRKSPAVQTVAWNRMVNREVLRQRRKPYIFTSNEIERLLSGALRFPSPKAP